MSQSPFTSAHLSSKCIAKVGILSPVVIVVFTQKKEGVGWTWHATSVDKYNNWVHTGMIVENTELWVTRGRAFVSHFDGKGIYIAARTRTFLTGASRVQVVATGYASSAPTTSPVEEEKSTKIPK